MGPPLFLRDKPIRISNSLASAIETASTENPSHEFAVVTKASLAYKFGDQTTETLGGNELIAMTLKEAQGCGAPIFTALKAPRELQKLLPPPTIPPMTLMPSTDLLANIPMKYKSFPIVQPPPNTYIVSVSPKYVPHQGPHWGLRGHARSLYGYNGWVVRMATESIVVTLRWTQLDDVTSEDQKLLRARITDEDAKPASKRFISGNKEGFMLELIGLTSKDVRSVWFAAIAHKLAGKPVDCYVWRGHILKDQIKTIVHHSVQLSPLTVAMIVIKQHADFLGTANVFSFQLDQVSKDLRGHKKLSESLGTDLFSYLLSNLVAAIEDKVKTEQSTPFVLLTALTNLLVAYLKREDQHGLFHTDKKTLTEKLQRLSTALFQDDVKANELSVHVYGIKIGAAYSAVINAAADIGRDIERNMAVLKGAVKIFFRMAPIATLVLLGGSPVSSAIDGVSKLAFDITDQTLKGKTDSAELIHSTASAFNHDIVWLAENGKVRAVNGTVLGPGQNMTKDLAKKFAMECFNTIKSTLPEGVEISKT